MMMSGSRIDRNEVTPYFWRYLRKFSITS